MAKESKREAFEQLYARLEERVSKLEQGGLSLEEAIAVYEEGMMLARQCQERLDEAELKITRLRESFATLPPRAPSAPDESDDLYGDPDDTVDEAGPLE